MLLTASLHLVRPLAAVSEGGGVEAAPPPPPPPTPLAGETSFTSTVDALSVLSAGQTARVERTVHARIEVGGRSNPIGICTRVSSIVGWGS